MSLSVLEPVKCPVCGAEPDFETYPRTGRASLWCGGNQEEIGRDVTALVTHEIYIAGPSPEAVFAEWRRRYPTPETNAPAKGDTKTGAGFEGMSTGNSENPMCKEDNNP